MDSKKENAELIRLIYTNGIFQTLAIIGWLVVLALFISS